MVANMCSIARTETISAPLCLLADQAKDKTQPRYPLTKAGGFKLPPAWHYRVLDVIGVVIGGAQKAQGLAFRLSAEGALAKSKTGKKQDLTDPLKVDNLSFGQRVDQHGMAYVLPALRNHLELGSLCPQASVTVDASGGG